MNDLITPLNYFVGACGDDPGVNNVTGSLTEHAFADPGNANPLVLLATCRRLSRDVFKLHMQNRLMGLIWLRYELSSVLEWPGQMSTPQNPPEIRIR